MGGNPGASGNSIEAMKDARWEPTKGADDIIKALLHHFNCSNLEELVRAKMPRFGQNDHTWDATVAYTCKAIEKNKIVPGELLAYYYELRLASA